MLKYDELEMKYGAPVAYSLLLEFEKVARIPTQIMSGIDPETRLVIALRAQDLLGGESALSMAA